MRKHIIALIAAAFALAAGAQNKDYMLNVGDFTEFTVVNGLNVVYRHVPDSAGIASFSCPEALSRAIVFQNRGRKLKIELDLDPTLPPMPIPTVTIYSMALTRAENWGDSTVTIQKINPGVEFKAKIMGNGDMVARDVMCTKVQASVQTGNGHIFITGKCQEAKYTIMSAGAIEAAGMEAVKVKCRLWGTGSIDCNSSTELSVSGMGTGSVYYLGEPTVNNRALSVKVHPMR